MTIEVTVYLLSGTIDHHDHVYRCVTQDGALKLYGQPIYGIHESIVSYPLTSIEKWKIKPR